MQLIFAFWINIKPTVIVLYVRREGGFIPLHFRSCLPSPNGGRFLTSFIVVINDAQTFQVQTAWNIFIWIRNEKYTPFGWQRRFFWFYFILFYYYFKIDHDDQQLHIISYPCRNNYLQFRRYVLIVPVVIY